MNHKQSQTYTPPNLIAGLDIGTTKVCMVLFCHYFLISKKIS